MNFNYDLVAFEALMLIYISVSALLFGISYTIKFIR